jgi:ankyrin repeat protein
MRNSTNHRAATNNDLANVSEFLDARVDVNSRDREGNTALHRVIRNDSSTMVRLLLSRGADTSLRNGWGPDWPDGVFLVENTVHPRMQELPCKNCLLMESILELPPLCILRRARPRRCAQVVAR